MRVSSLKGSWGLVLGYFLFGVNYFLNSADGGTTWKYPEFQINRNPYKKPVNVVLLLPGNPKYMFSYLHMYPAIQIALDKVSANRTLLPNHYLEVRYKDTQCDEALGMKFAIEYFIKKQVDVFLGPVCDYVVAPVLRQLKFWQLPMITVGATAWGFGVKRKLTYPMLNRVGPINYNSMSKFFQLQLQLYNWSKVKMLYEKSGQDYILLDLCHLTLEALVNEMRKLPEMKDLSHFRFEPKMDLNRLLREEIGLDHGGEFKIAILRNIFWLNKRTRPEIIFIYGSQNRISYFQSIL